MAETKAIHGSWAALVAGSVASRNQTGLGVVFYDDYGELVKFLFSGVEKAISRGDLPEAVRDYQPDVPQTRSEMEDALDRSGNTMSVVRWEALAPTIDWSQEVIEDCYRMVIGEEDHGNDKEPEPALDRPGLSKHGIAALAHHKP